MITISDVERSIWKGVTKADLISYHHTVSGLILPYLKDRPQSLYIKPTNANAPGFYIKDMEGREPTVSAPLAWREINKNLDPSSFTMHNIQARIKNKGDLFAGLLDRQWALARSA
jgi:DNA primase